MIDKIKNVKKIITKRVNDIQNDLVEDIEFLAALNLVPYIGSSLVTLLTGKHIKRKWERIEYFINLFKKEIQLIEKGRVDKNYLESDEFIILFEKLLIEVTKQYEKKKIEYFKNLLINSIKVGSPISAYKELYLHHLSSMSYLHFLILKYFFERHGDKNYDENRNSGDPVTYGELEKKFGWPSNDYKPKGIIDDLLGRGLIFDSSIGTYGYTPFNFKITDFGTSFINFTLKSK